MKRREAIKNTALMLGYAVSASTLAGIMGGCEASNTPNWTPSFLTKEQGDLVAAMAERIMPKTDTPGAIDVGVHEFIDTLIGKYMKEKEKTIFMNGLTEVEIAAQAAHKKSFVKLSPEQQDAILTAMANGAQGKKDTFFEQMKQLTIAGYFTSKVGGTEVLHYDPIPGNYDGCVPMEKVGRVNWTL